MGELETKDRILTILREKPGLSTSRVAAAMGMDDSSVDYHLRRLRKQGRLLNERVGREMVWYVNGAGYCPLLRMALPALRREGVARVAQTLDATPQTASELAARADMRVGPTRWALQVLEEAGLVERTPSGRAMLREGAQLCVQRALAAEGCPLWGRCAISQSIAEPQSSRSRPGLAGSRSPSTGSRPSLGTSSVV